MWVALGFGALILVINGLINKGVGGRSDGVKFASYTKAGNQYFDVETMKEITKDEARARAAAEGLPFS